MNEVHDAIDAAVSEAEFLRNLLKKKPTKQVRAVEEQSVIKATSLAWFNNHRPTLAPYFDNDILSAVDVHYQQMLSSSQKAAVRSGYIFRLKSLSTGQNLIFESA